MWDNDCFRPDSAPEVRKRSNETWFKIDYGQLHIKIKSMWLRRVYFVLWKFLRARFLVPKRQAVFLKNAARACQSRLAASVLST